MTVLMCVLGWAIVAFVLWGMWRGLKAFENHAQDKYAHPFLLSAIGMIAVAVAGVLAFAGTYWYYSALREHGDPLDGQILVVAAGCVLVALVIYNILRTSVILGTAGSALQIAIFGLLLPFIAVLVVLGAMGSVIKHTGGPPIVMFWWR